MNCVWWEVEGGGGSTSKVPREKSEARALGVKRREGRLAELGGGLRTAMGVGGRRHTRNMVNVAWKEEALAYPAAVLQWRSGQTRWLDRWVPGAERRKRLPPLKWLKTFSTLRR